MKKLLSYTAAFVMVTGIALASTNVIFTLGGTGNICSGSVADTGVFTITGCTIPIGSVTGGAPLASPALTGTPTAPTAAATTNTTQLATTAMVQAAFANNITPYAPLASPNLSGTPTAPTASSSTNTTQIASTAMVQSAITANAPSGYYVGVHNGGGAPTWGSSANAGAQAFFTDCRESGEGAGVGTGCVVYADKNGTIKAMWSGLAPTY